MGKGGRRWADPSSWSFLAGILWGPGGLTFLDGVQKLPHRERAGIEEGVKLVVFYHKACGKWRLCKAPFWQVHRCKCLWAWGRRDPRRQRLLGRSERPGRSPPATSIWSTGLSRVRAILHVPAFVLATAHFPRLKLQTWKVRMSMYERVGRSCSITSSYY